MICIQNNIVCNSDKGTYYFLDVRDTSPLELSPSLVTSLLAPITIRVSKIYGQ